jgi:Spy/CpxP family protein refolding chaperone
MKTLSLVTTCLLSLSTLAFAQAPSGDAAQPPHKPRFDCSQAKDPKNCEARRAKMKEMRGKAAKACEGKHGGERRECMRHELCAQAKDPKACEARAEKAKAERRKAHQEMHKQEKQEK